MYNLVWAAIINCQLLLVNHKLVMIFKQNHVNNLLRKKTLISWLKMRGNPFATNVVYSWSSNDNA